MRKTNWPELLADFIDARTDMPFAWGTNDCATFAAAWVTLATGQVIDLPTYSDALPAARMIQADGLAALAEAQLGPPRTFATSAQRGDVALVDLGERQALGVVVGEHVAGPAENGLLLVPRSSIIKAWGV